MVSKKDRKAFEGTVLPPEPEDAVDHLGENREKRANTALLRRVFARRAAGDSKEEAIEKAAPAHRLGVDFARRSPVRGEPVSGGGQVANILPGVRWQATTSASRGLYPFAAPSGAHVRGVPLGQNLHTGEPIGLDPAQWMIDGLVTNTGIWIQGQPGIGKSTIVKRLGTGLTAFGFRMQVQGDLKGEYTDIVTALGGQVIRIGRGHDVLNPLDISALRGAINAAVGQDKQNIIDDASEMRMALLEGLLAIESDGQRLRPSQRVLLSRAIDVASDAAQQYDRRDPIIPEVLKVMMEGPEHLRSAVAAYDPLEYERQTLEVVSALRLMCEGPIKGLFDGESTFELDPSLPALSLDLSAVDEAPDSVVAAAMLCSWAWTAALSRGESSSGRRRNVFSVQDELWRALRVAPGLVETSDRITRLGRSKGAVHAQVTHSMEDLDALPTEQDRKKAHGLASRNAIKIIGGCDAQEIDRLRQITPISDREEAEITSWAAPPTWMAGQAHPGRGRSMIKSGNRQGLPTRTILAQREIELYDTDKAFASIKNKQMDALSVGAVG